MTNELQRIPQSESAVQISQDPYSLMRHAMERNVDVTVIERLSALAERWEASRAKRQYDEALALFQSKCPIIQKRKIVPNKTGGIRYKYAPLDDIVCQVRSLIQECGFSYTVTAKVDKNQIKAICSIKHAAGHSEVSEFEVPIDPEAFMSQQQKFGAAMTFAKRYAFCNGLGILTGDEDVDGQNQAPKPSGPSSLHSGSAAPTNSEKLLKRALIDATRKIHRIESGYALDEAALGAITQWLIDEGLVSDTETVADLSGDRLIKAVEKAKGIR